MKNLLNCHCMGLHSFPISLENGLYRRIFYADTNHELWKLLKIAIHPHHVDIKITVLEGELLNPLYKIDKHGWRYKKFQWNSHIRNGNGGFEYLGEEKLIQISNYKHKEGDIVVMQACELHTVHVEKGNVCVWLIEEAVPSCEYFPINYSIYDLTQWTPQGLYIEVNDSVRQKYIGKFENALSQVTKV